ncbi:MAG: dTDP-4-dehydrorhamnose 3,5-epimerase [Muribaculaceae bacterium]|nr:dTDP-4-dehydrorhamnose 3,5-epimerase [Muribaculaceae bacterium]
MEVITTPISGLVVLKPRVFSDARGYFFEAYSEREFARATGIDVDFVQDNQARSTYGVLRGLHFQRGEAAQAKLLRVTEGRVLDVAVDIREGSPTFGRHHAVELSADNFLQFYIPRGFAHGYLVLSETAVVQYKADNYYAPEAEGGIIWNDPAIGIDWPLPEERIVLSEKDTRWGLLKDTLL